MGAGWQRLYGVEVRLRVSRDIVRACARAGKSVYKYIVFVGMRLFLSSYSLEVSSSHISIYIKLMDNTLNLL